MTVSALRALLASDRVTHVPGVHDPLTAALAVRAGHAAVHLSGTAVAATMLGRPDVAYPHAAQVADRASTLGPALGGVPLLADAGTGYDDPAAAVWTALAYSRAGVSGLLLPDTGRAIDATAAKISALADQVPEMVVIAHTGAGAGLDLDLDLTIVRCRAFAEAGAAAVLADGVGTLAELTALHRALLGVPLVVDRSEAGPPGPVLADAELAAAGVRLVLHPMSALLAAVRAISLTYRAIADTGTAEPVDRMPWAAYTALTTPVSPDAGHVPENLQT